MWTPEHTLHRYSLLISLTLIVMAIIAQPAQAATKPKHGCAPLVPPPVSGTLIQPPAIQGLLFINEVLLAPRTIWNCSELSKPTTQNNDVWIELYNAQSQPFDLYAVHTSIDSGPNTNAFYLPSGSALAAHSFLVVFPRTSETFTRTQDHTLRLLITGIVIDTVTVPTLLPDQSYARVPDGSTHWQITNTPTIDTSNGQSSALPPNSGNGQPTTSGIGDSNANSGTPLAWSTLSFPNTTTPISATATTTWLPAPSLAIPQSAAMTGLDLFHKIALSILVLALAVTLFWCWRLLSFP